MPRSRLILCALTALCAWTIAFSEDDATFAVPEILASNVAFWKKIYTEVPLTEGLFHDRDNPLVIYRQMAIGQLSGRARRDAIRKVELEIVATLDAIVQKAGAELTPEERRVKELFDTNAPAGALDGARERIRFQQGQRERFVEGLERSGMYLDTIRAILTKHNVPLRLAYLPHVESSFDVDAYSKVGAAGLWQFMRSTGKVFGLKVDYLVDERRDPLMATEAAAKLLAFNYRELQSWPLAITAYNHGTAGMKRAVDKTGSRDIAVIIERHESPSFQFASKNFYGCFLAASEIAMNHQRYFPTVVLRERAVWTDAELPAYVRPSVVVRYAGVSEDVLRKLNPALRPVVFQHEKQIPAGYVLHMPATLTPREVQDKFALIPDSLRSAKPERPQYYRVERGDNLYGIAARLGVQAEELASANGITRANKIYAGQVLQIPGSSRRAAAPATVALAPAPTATPKPSASVAPSTPPAPASAPQPSAPDTAALEAPSAVAVAPVPPSPSPSDTAARAPVAAAPDSLRDLLMATADTLPAATRTSGAAGAQFDVSIYNLETVVESPTIARIRVAINETLGHYAEWLDIPTMRIRTLNHMRGRSDIRVGQNLLIPLDEPDALERFAKTRLEYHLANEEDFYGRFKVTDVKQKVVRRGETLWDLSSEDNGTPLWLLKKHNKDADFENLVPGTPLWMPVIEERSADDIAMEQLEDAGTQPAYREPLAPRAGPGRLEF